MLGPYSVLLVSVVMGATNAPQVEWAFETQGKIYASPILADLEGDGKPEVIVCASRDERVICLDGEGELRWDCCIHDAGADGIQATPSVVDYDGDGRQEVFFLTTGGTAGCIDYQGRLIWRVFTGDHVDYSGPVLADVDNDGRIEVVFGSDSGTVYCLDDCGIERWHYQGDGQIRGIPAVAWHEPSSSMRIFVEFGGGTAACLSSEGKVVWAHNEPMPRGERRSGPAVGDVDGDGGLDVVLVTEDFRVIVRDAFTGDEKWRWKGEHRIDSTNSVALADFDGSGRLDIVCGDGSGQGGPGRVYRLRDGQPLWTADVGGSVVQGPSIGDVDGDGELDILVCSRSKRLICLGADGREKWSVPSATEVLTTPALGDIDGDGQVEVVFTSKDRFVRCVTVGGAYDAAKLPWPMMNHDAQLSGNAGGAPFKAVVPTPPGARGPLLRLDRFAPLRMGDNRVEFTFTNDSPRPRHLEATAEATRPDGSRVSLTETNRREAFETQAATFNLPALFDGPYTLRLRLADMGTGETLATLEESDELKAFEAERIAAKALLDSATGLAGLTADARLRSYLSEALAGAHARVLTAIDAADSDAQPTPGQRRARIDQVVAAMRELRRVAARVNAAHATPVPAADFAMVTDTPLRKVFRDEPYLTNVAEPAVPAIALAGNEYEGVQLVVVPLGKDLDHLQFAAGDLAQVGGSGIIPADQITIHRIGYVEIGPPEYNWFVEKQGWYPDITFPGDPIDVSAEQDAQPFFVTVKATADTAPGDYAGMIRVTADDCAPLEIPIEVHVWAFSLPEKPNLKVSLWMNENYLQRFYKYEGRTPFEMRKRYYDYHLEHRASPIKDFPLDGGDMLEDFQYLMSKGQNCFFLALPEYLEEAERPAFAERLRNTRDLLETRGWADLGLIYTRDEVAVVARHLIPKVVEMNQWVKTVLPDWPRLQTSAPEQSLFGAVDVWCPTIDHFDPVVLAERMAQGDRLWFYTVWGRPGIMLEFPATDHRLMFWMCWKYGAEGFLYWGTTHWDLNTTTDKRWPEIPWVPYNRQPGHNGCGYLLYPGPDGTPLGSIRFELIRDGIEDYEYLYLLRSLLVELGDRVSDELRLRAQAELDVAPEVLVDHTTFTDDPYAILHARARIAGLIEELRRVATP